MNKLKLRGDTCLVRMHVQEVTMQSTQGETLLIVKEDSENLDAVSHKSIIDYAADR